VVDDHPENLIAFSASLRHVEVELLMANGGQEAIAIAEEQELALILLDAQMPGMDGFETATRLRERTGSVRVPIVFVTAHYSDVAHVRRAYECGAVDYINKPVEPFILEAKVKIFADLYEHRCSLSLALNQLNDVHLKYQETQAQLHQASKLSHLGEMATGMAHEINQPLTHIRGMLYVLKQSIRQGEDVSSMLTYIEESSRQAERIDRLVDHLRTFGRTQGQEREAVSVQLILERALILFNERLRLLGIEVASEIPKGLFVNGNANDIEQVFINLVQNAMDAIEDKRKSQTERAQSESIRVSARFGRENRQPSGDDDNRQVVIEVHDSGAGIEDSVRDRLFEPFFTTREVGKGTGLGLSLVYGIVVDHGGTITADNASNGGACFRVILPEATREQRNRLPLSAH